MKDHLIFGAQRASMLCQKCRKARGIAVHPEWRDSFSAFRSYMGPRPSNKHSVDRIDNDGNYEPGNVRWATPIQQARNKRSNRRLEAFGKSFCLIEWSEMSGISSKKIRCRLRAGETLESIISARISDLSEALGREPSKATESEIESAWHTGPESVSR